MYKLLLIVWGLLSVAFGAKAHSPVYDTVAKQIVKPVHPVQRLQNDSTKIDIRNFNSKAVEQYRNDKAFDYHRDEDRNLSWWDRFWRWLWRMIENLLGKRTTATPDKSTNPIVQYVVLALAVCILIYVLVKVMGVNLTHLFGRESQQVNIPYTESLENIHEITFDDEIEKALAQHNYRLAVRLLYLRSLKHLNDAHLINWQIDKTNATYLNELTDNNQRQSFTVLTRQFEYVWYGDFPIDGNSYQNINILFQDFKKMLP